MIECKHVTGANQVPSEQVKQKELKYSTAGLGLSQLFFKSFGFTVPTIARSVVTNTKSKNVILIVGSNSNIISICLLI